MLLSLMVVDRNACVTMTRTRRCPRRTTKYGTGFDT